MSKANSRSRFLARKAPFLDAVSLRLLANSLVLCYFDYGLGSWYGGLIKALKHKLQVSQNSLVRVVLGLTSRDCVGKLLFQQLGWHPLEARAVQLQLRVVHNVCNHKSPAYLKNHFTRSRDAHAYHTRASNADLYLPKLKTNIGKCTLKYSGVVKWNKSPLDIKSIDNYHCCRKKNPGSREFKSLLTLTCLPPCDCCMLVIDLYAHCTLIQKIRVREVSCIFLAS